MIKGLLFLISISAFASSDSLFKCPKGITSHPDMILYIQNHTQKIEDSIKKLIEDSGKEYSINMAYYYLQRESISQKCELFELMEGQRAELLMNQCELDELSRLESFLKSFMKAMDNF